LGAINVRPANIIAEAGGHHHRHRHSGGVPYRAPYRAPDLVGNYHFVPVFNPADFDKGISSHSLAATGSAVATTQSSAAAAPATSAFWHTVGQAYNVGATVASYYMGNDPCRVASGRRRMVASAESQLAVQTDETFEDWNNRNAALIVSRGGTNTQLARAMYQRMEPPSQSQADCVQPAVDTLEESHAPGPETVEIDWPGAQADCVQETVQLGTGNTEVSNQGPKAATTESVAKPDCGQPDATQDYTLYVIGLILLVALVAIMMN
jgi:hypothetical protein